MLQMIFAFFRWFYSTINGLIRHIKFMPRGEVDKVDKVDKVDRVDRVDRADRVDKFDLLLQTRLKSLSRICHELKI